MSGKAIIDITQNAVRQLCRAQQNGMLLRLSVERGGCAGSKHAMKYIPRDAVGQHDEMVYAGDAKLVIDGGSVFRLIGSTLDYHETEVSEGYTVNNPNAKNACGCGISFL